MNNERYNGWTNWDTWNSYNWITDDELMYRRACRSTDPDHLQEIMEDYIKSVNDVCEKHTNKCKNICPHYSFFLRSFSIALKSISLDFN